MLLSATILIITCCQTARKAAPPPPSNYVQQIDTLLTTKSYFEARDLFALKKTELPEVDQLRIEANLLSFFNRLEDSNQLIDQLFKKHENQLDSGVIKNLLNTQLSNSIKLFEYRRASEISDRLIAELGGLMEAEDLWGTQNNNIIWKALQNHPKQTASFQGDSQIELFRDEAGLKNLYARYKARNYPFIFDTGANLSTVIESQASAMEMEIIADARVSVGTITGQRVEAKIGVAPQLSIDKMTFQHVVFFGFPRRGALHSSNQLSD